MTASAFDPRSVRISSASRCRCFLDGRLGRLDQQLGAGVAAEVPAEEVEPFVRETILVLSSFRARPRSASHPASFSRTLTACSLLKQQIAKSSAYLIAAGELPRTCPAPDGPDWWRTPAASSRPCSATSPSGPSGVRDVRRASTLNVADWLPSRVGSVRRVREAGGIRGAGACHRGPSRPAGGRQERTVVHDRVAGGTGARAGRPVPTDA